MALPTSGMNRSVRVSTPLAPEALVFEAMTADEMLGRPFSLEVDLLSELPSINPQGLLGKPLAVHIDAAQGVRHFHGIVTEFRAVGETQRFLRYRASARSYLELLAFRSNCRIFQGLTIPQIVRRVLKSGDVPHSATELKNSYPVREYVVQYRESDLNFVSRLMEEAGIFYYFKHDESQHTLVLLDDVSVLEPASGYETIRYFPPDGSGRIREEHISTWSQGARLVPGRFTLRNYRYDKPKVLPTASTKTLRQTQEGTGRAGAEYEIYDYPGALLTADEGTGETANRLWEQECWLEAAQATGDTRGVGAGHVVKVDNLSRLVPADKAFLVAKASYSVQTNAYESDGAPSGVPEFSASFTLLDAQTEYRTPRDTPKPRVAGPQTATVVPRKQQPDEEICTDEQGRVMVKFHWDRRGEVNGPEDEDEDKDKGQSCWIRVSQAWAGAGWGAMHIPRVGQEVIVDFLEGDPDRPIITGRVYNGDNKPPYPQQPTQSGIKSRSTKGGTPDNFNEIRFEDKKGQEDLFIQAEKTQTTKVKQSQTITVGADRSCSVGGNESVTVSKDRSVHVTGNQSVTIDGKGSGPVHSSVSVTGKHKLHASDTIDVDAPTHIRLQVGKSVLLMEDGKITLSIAGTTLVVLDDNVFAKSKGGAHVLLDANANAQSNGGAQVLLDDNVMAQSKAGTQLVLDGNAVLGTAGDAHVTAANIHLTGQQKVVAGGASSSLELAASGASMSGTKATVAGSAVTEITGALVKIN